MPRYLYRGVNAKIHAKNGGRLVPKMIGAEFKRDVYYSEEVYYGDGSTYGKSTANAALMHQRDSARYPTSGVSTTPHIENARTYATHNDCSGYVYKIDTGLLEAAGVTMHDVRDYAAQPAIPGDSEVILVARDHGPLPPEVVVEVIDA